MTDWTRLRDDDHRLPRTDLGVALDELVGLLDDPDPEVRDGTSFTLLATWVDRGDLDERLGVLVGRLVDRLEAPPVHPDAVLGRSFAALVLAVCAAHDATARVVPEALHARWVTTLVEWYPTEQDTRGHDLRLGWVHAVAHGADVLGELAVHPATGPTDAVRVLDALVTRTVDGPSPGWRHGEPDRVALAVLAVLGRDDLPDERIAALLARLGEGADVLTADPGTASWDRAQDAQAVLRAIHLLRLLRDAPAPAAVVEALRHTNAAYLR